MRINQCLIQIILTLGLMCPSLVVAADYEVVKGSELTFIAKITGSSFKGETQALAGAVQFNEAGSELVFANIQIKADSFETGMGLRDSHMNKKYLQVKKYPSIDFSLKSQPVNMQKGATSRLKGILKFHGVEKQIEVDAVVKSQSETEISIESNFDLNITDYKIRKPKFAVVKMSPELKLQLILVLRKK